MGEFTDSRHSQNHHSEQARPKARKGINPFTGEETVFKAKPASIAVKIRPLKKLKEFAASGAGRRIPAWTSGPVDWPRRGVRNHSLRQHRTVRAFLPASVSPLPGLASMAWVKIRASKISR